MRCKRGYTVSTVMKCRPSWLRVNLGFWVVFFAVTSAAASLLPESSELNPIEGESFDGPLFEMIDPEVSGIEAMNEYSHPEAWKQYWHQYYNGSIGTGIAVGDVNGDELPDIYLVSKDSPNSLYLNNGDFTFRDETNRAGVAGQEGFGSGACFVDIDNDGDLDIYVGYIGFPNQLFINDGQGRFEEQSAAWGLDINTGTNMPSFGDMDLDGDLDLYLQCNFLAAANIPEGMPDLFLENKGDRFEDITKRAGISGRAQGHAAIWWDYNEDGWPDIYVANDFEPTDKLYRNNKDGTFTDVIQDTLVSSPYFGMGADLGDVNNDGYVDFLVADMATEDHMKHHTSTGTQENFLLDISKSKISQYMRNMLSVKIGSNQFMEVAHQSGLEATGWTWAVRLVDMDNDGLLDAYFTNGMVREYHNRDRAERLGAGSSVQQRIVNHETGPPLIEKNLAYKNLGGLAFEPTSAAWGLDLAGISFAAAFADLDRDGDLDLIINNLNAQPTLYRNRSVNGDRVTMRLVGEESNRYGIGAKVRARSGDLLQMRELSLTRGYMSHDEPMVHFAFPDAAQIDSLEIEWPSGARQVLANLPTGRHYRIQESDQGKVDDSVVTSVPSLFSRSSIKIPRDARSTEDFYDSYAKQPLLPFDESRKGPSIALGDLDLDGWLDVVMGGSTGQETRVFKNQDGKALELVEFDVFYDDYDAEDGNIVLFDYDGDSDLDMMIPAGSVELDADSDYYKDRVYVQGSDLEFDRLPEEAFDAPALSSEGATSLDVNGDGRLDFLVAGGPKKDQYPFAEENQVWLRSGDGYSRDRESAFAVAFARCGKISELLSVDIDDDGDEDLAIAAEWGAPQIWRNDESGLSRLSGAFPEADLKGIWRSVAAGDFDQDGRIDLVFGNLGGNSKYRASPEAPAALFAQLRRGRGAHVEAYTEEGRLLPRETRNMLYKQFPMEMRRSSRTYRQFAGMTIDEIFPNLATDFERFEINETRSLVLFQREANQFTPVPLPALAQTGIAIDLLVADFNGDDRDDIVIAHKPLPPNAWAERRLKGHLSLFLGEKGGAFQSLVPLESGLEVNGFPQRLAYGDLDNDGKGELLVPLSEGPLLIFGQN